MTSALVTSMRASAGEMTELLRALVEVESPSSDLEATARCTKVAAEAIEGLLGVQPERVVLEGRTHLRADLGGTRRIVLIGHLDTVWPVGTLDRWPFAVDGDMATGPGSFDMKAGVVQMLFALKALDRHDGVTVLLTTDEEVGSPTAAALIEETVAGAKAALILEPSADGALKTARKGTAIYGLSAHGRASHAGLDPEKGINAVVELAHQIVEISSLGDPQLGTTVTPTLVSGGSAGNTVPATARVHIDVRVPTIAERERVDAALRALKPVVPGTTLQIEVGASSAPLERSSSAELFARAQWIASELGLPLLEEASVGGGSDGNLTASLGIPTLDGLGPIGGKAHSEGEFVYLPAMPERAALVAALVRDLLIEA